MPTRTRLAGDRDARADAWFTALSPLWYHVTCLLSNIHAPLNKLPDYLRNEVFKDRSKRCHFLISIYKPVSCTLSALQAHSILVHEMVHAPDEEIRRGRCQTPPGLNIYSATVRKHKYWPADPICMLVLLIGFVMWPRAIVRRQAIILGVDNYEQAGIVRDSICKQAKVNNSWMLSVEGYTYKDQLSHKTGTNKHYHLIKNKIEIHGFNTQNTCICCMSGNGQERELSFNAMHIQI